MVILFKSPGYVCSLICFRVLICSGLGTEEKGFVKVDSSCDSDWEGTSHTKLRLKTDVKKQQQKLWDKKECKEPVHAFSIYLSTHLTLYNWIGSVLKSLRKDFILNCRSQPASSMLR